MTTIKLKSIADITETEHYIFDTEVQCVAYGEHWEEQIKLSAGGLSCGIRRDIIV